MAKKNIIVQVDEQMHRDLKVKASQQGKTLADVLRDLIAAFIGKPTGKPKDGKQQ